MASASSRSTGVRTTSHSGRTPRATASTGSKARARSIQAVIAPPVCASATARSAAVVLPDDASPRSATVASRGRPPVPRIASSAANPVGTTRPSSTAGVPGRRTGAGARGVGASGSGEAGSDAGASSGRESGSGSGRAIGARASAPSTANAMSPPRRGAAAPQRVWSAASASETSDAPVIGRPIIERMFDSSRVRIAHRRWAVLAAGCRPSLARGIQASRQARGPQPSIQLRIPWADSPPGPVAHNGTGPLPAGRFGRGVTLEACRAMYG